MDIPVMGHIGLTPQSYHRMGGHKVQGRSQGYEPGGRDRLLDDAHAVDQAGAFALVIEGVPSDLAGEITRKVSIPTIGIGAGLECDGQVLVLHDLLGITKRDFTFAKKYANLHATITEAIETYAAEVRNGEWPDTAHSYK
jgi:3-methyl-2-oxobutanoate hydroxymethyltransferase